jgi:hypothetical protein
MILAFLTFPDLLTNARVFHFVDNTTALSAAAFGYSSKPDLAHLVNIYHILHFQLRSSTWFEWVPSAANIADVPSRPEFDTFGHSQWGILDEISAVPRPMVFPSESQIFQPLEAWFRFFEQ